MPAIFQLVHRRRPAAARPPRPINFAGDIEHALGRRRDRAADHLRRRPVLLAARPTRTSSTPTHAEDDHVGEPLDRARRRDHARDRRRRGRRDVGDPRRLDRRRRRSRSACRRSSSASSWSRSSATPPSTGSRSTSPTRDKMDLSVNIAIGSSAQIALFVAPVLVLLSFVVGAVPDGAGLQRARARGDRPRGPDRATRSRTRASRPGSRALQLLAVYVVLGLHLLLRLMIGWRSSRARAVAGPGGITVVLLWVDLHFFARGREPTFREGVVWSIGWLVVLAARRRRRAAARLSGADDAVTYTTVYFIERSLSLDNLFVFLLLFAYFGVPERVPRAAAVLGHRRRARAARRWRSSAASR